MSRVSLFNTTKCTYSQNLERLHEKNMEDMRIPMEKIWKPRKTRLKIKFSIKVQF